MESKAFLNCVSAGEHDCSDMHSWGPGIRQVYILHIVTSGKGYFEMCGITRQVTKGQVFLIYPGETISYYPDKDDPFTYTWVDFYGSMAKNLLGCTAFSKSNPVSPVFSINELIPLFDSAKSSFSNKGKCYSCEPSIMKILAFFIEYYPSDDYNTDRYNYIDRAVDYIFANFHKSALKVQQIADDIGICRAHLYRLFYETYNMSPSDYIINERMKKACEMLKSTDLPIKSVSVSVGYADPLYFSLAFKKFTGLNPSKYRKDED